MAFFFTVSSPSLITMISLTFFRDNGVKLRPKTMAVFFQLVTNLVPLSRPGEKITELGGQIATQTELFR